MGYWEGENVFYVSSTNQQGEEEYVYNYVDTQSSIWKANAKFEKFVTKDRHFCQLFRRMLHVWDGNHCLQTW